MTDGTRASAKERRASIDDLGAAGNELCEQHLRLAAGGSRDKGFVLKVGTYVGTVPLDVSLKW